ncbi:unnamed protein product [Cunninghamella blakesleeana]
MKNITLLTRRKSRSRAGLFNKGKSSALGSNDTARKGVVDLVFSEASFLNDSNNSNNNNNNNITIVPCSNSPSISPTTRYNKKVLDKENNHPSLIQDEATRFFNSIKKQPDHYHQQLQQRSFNSFHSNSLQASSSTYLNKKNDDTYITVENNNVLQSSPLPPHQQQVPVYARGTTPQKYSPKTYIHPAFSISSFNKDDHSINNNIHLSRSVEPWESASVNHHQRATVFSPSPHQPSFSFNSNYDDDNQYHHYNEYHDHLYTDIDKNGTNHMKFPTIIEPSATISKTVIDNQIHSYHHIPQQQQASSPSSSLNQQHNQQNILSNIYNKNFINHHEHHEHQQQRFPLFTSSSTFINPQPSKMTELESVIPFIPNKYLMHHPSSSSSIYIPPHLSSHHSTIYPMNGIMTNINKKYGYHDKDDYLNDTLTITTQSPLHQRIQNNPSIPITSSTSSSIHYLDSYSLLTETAAQNTSTKLPFSTSFKL